MEQKSKVSIVIPLYNTEMYIEECLESVLSQTYKNIEVIVIDDASTDNSLKLCKKYFSDNRLKIIRHESNKKIEKTRNDGINIATGKWIMFLDSDDRISVDGIERVMKKIESEDIDFAIMPYYRWLEKKLMKDSSTLNSGVYTKQQIVMSLLDTLPYSVFCCVGAKIYRRCFLNKNHIKFSRKYLYNEDGGFVLSALKVANKIGYYDIPYYYYRIRQNGSYQSTYRPNTIENLSVTNFLMKDIFEEEGLFKIKEKAYYERRASLFCVALIEEIKFGGYSQYTKEFKCITEMDDFSKIYNNSVNYSNKMRIVLFMLKKNLKLLLYIIIKMSIIMSGAERL